MKELTQEEMTQVSGGTQPSCNASDPAPYSGSTYSCRNAAVMPFVTFHCN